MFSPDTPHFLHIVQEMVSERHLLLKRTNTCRGFKEEGKLLKTFFSSIVLKESGCLTRSNKAFTTWESKNNSKKNLNKSER